MSYIAEHIDTEKFEAGLENNRKYQEQLHEEAIKRATAEFQGYCKCLEDVREMLHCANYEKESDEFDRGAIDALDNLRYMFGFLLPNGQTPPRKIGEKAMGYVKDTNESLNKVIRHAYIDGANNAFYGVCKELDVQYQDIQDTNPGIDEKAHMIAERIKKAFGEVTDDGMD